VYTGKLNNCYPVYFQAGTLTALAETCGFQEQDMPLLRNLMKRHIRSFLLLKLHSNPSCSTLMWCAQEQTLHQVTCECCSGQPCAEVLYVTSNPKPVSTFSCLGKLECQRRQGITNPHRASGPSCALVQDVCRHLYLPIVVQATTNHSLQEAEQKSRFHCGGERVIMPAVDE